jgi:hypothetical protein
VNTGLDHFELTEADVNRIQRRDSRPNGLWLGLGAGIAAAWIAPGCALAIARLRADRSFLNVPMRTQGAG